MKNKKTLKVIKIILIVIIAAVALAAAGIYFAYEYAIKPKSEQIINAVDEIIRDEEILKEIEPYLESEEMEAILNQTEVLEQIDEEVSEQETQSGTDKKDNEVKKDTKPNKKTDNKKTAGKTDNKTSEPKKSKEEYSSQTEYIKDNVSAADFSKGVSYASRVDVGYVMGLVSGGLTIEEKRELKAYLKKHFSSGEIAEGISLYSKYSHLLR